MKPDLHSRVQIYCVGVSNNFPFGRQADRISTLENSKRADCIERVSDSCEGLMRPSQPKLHDVLHAMPEYFNTMPPLSKKVAGLPKALKSKSEIIHALRESLQLCFGHRKST